MLMSMSTSDGPIRTWYRINRTMNCLMLMSNIRLWRYVAADHLALGCAVIRKNIYFGYNLWDVQILGATIEKYVIPIWHTVLCCDTNPKFCCYWAVAVVGLADWSNAEGDLQCSPALPRGDLWYSISLHVLPSGAGEKKSQQVPSRVQYKYSLPQTLSQPQPNRRHMPCATTD